jgi:hypothetical protein
VGVDTYMLRTPHELAGAFRLFANTDVGCESMFFHVEEDTPVKLEPRWLELHELIASVEKQVGESQRAIAEILEYLEKL